MHSYIHTHTLVYIGMYTYTLENYTVIMNRVYMLKEEDGGRKRKEKGNMYASVPKTVKQVDLGAKKRIWIRVHRFEICEYFHFSLISESYKSYIITIAVLGLHGDRPSWQQFFLSFSLGLRIL